MLSALIGGFVFGLVQFRAVGLVGSVISATLGAVILLLLLLRRLRRI